MRTNEGNIGSNEQPKDRPKDTRENSWWKQERGKWWNDCIDGKKEQNEEEIAAENMNECVKNRTRVWMTERMTEIVVINGQMISLLNGRMKPLNKWVEEENRWTKELAEALTAKLNQLTNLINVWMPVLEEVVNGGDKGIGTGTDDGCKLLKWKIHKRTTYFVDGKRTNELAIRWAIDNGEWGRWYGGMSK